MKEKNETEIWLSNQLDKVNKEKEKIDAEIKEIHNNNAVWTRHVFEEEKKRKRKNLVKKLDILRKKRRQLVQKANSIKRHLNKKDE